MALAKQCCDQQRYEQIRVCIEEPSAHDTWTDPAQNVGPGVQVGCDQPRDVYTDAQQTHRHHCDSDHRSKCSEVSDQQHAQ